MLTLMNALPTGPQPDFVRPLDPASPGLAAERQLVQRVFERCDEVIEQECAASSVPPEFLGALAANESGGCAEATRFEPAVYRHLQAVAEGGSPAFGSITVAELNREIAELLPANDAALHARYLTRSFAAAHSTELQSATDEVLRELATSWGYTQIMGYHMIGRPGEVRQLLEPHFHFRMAIRLLSEFVVDYQLDPRREFAQMFCCWNTGRPYGRTFDPNYVEKGLRRMQIYRQFRQVRAAR